jgi:hypothetical protein
MHQGVRSLAPAASLDLTARIVVAFAVSIPLLGALVPAPRPGTTGSITARTTASARSMRSSGKVIGCPCTSAPVRGRRAPRH